MPDSKNARWLANFEARGDDVKDAKDLVPEQGAANDADGWQQYRRWISKAPAPTTRRVGIDPTLYKWRNYRDWSDEVKRSWPEKDED